MLATDRQTGYPSIDKPWLKYYSDEEWSNPVPERTLWRTVYENNKDNLDTIALNYYGNKITYRKLFREIEKCQYTLRKYNVKKGDNIALLMLTIPETLYLFFALNKIGACANFINPLFSEKEICQLINESDASIIFVLDVMFEKIINILEKINVDKIVVVPMETSLPLAKKLIVKVKKGKKFPKDEKIFKWSQWVIKGRIPQQNDVYKYSQPAVMVYSSGSTGTPKGIVLSNDGINATLSYYDKTEYRLKRGSTFLCMGSPWASTGLVFATLMPLNKGLSVELHLEFSEEDFLKMINGSSASATLATLSQWIYVARHGNERKLDMSGMVCPVSGGEKVLPETENLINEFLKGHGSKSGLLIGYGMCELGSAVSTNSIEHRKTGSVGFPIKGVTVAAFNVRTDEECKYNERGEIRVLSPACMKGYYKNPEATSDFFFTDSKGREWGRTGDIGYVDEDGFLFVQGRATDFIHIAPNNNIFCFDIEDVIMQNSDVFQCEVVGVRGSDGFDHAYAFIVLKSECTNAIEDIITEIKHLCFTNLGEKSCPIGYKILDEFPVKATGKRDMDKIKEMAEMIDKGEMIENA